jgi:hypothetical protein
MFSSQWKRREMVQYMYQYQTDTSTVRYQLARVGTSKHTPGANVCVSSEVWTTVGENCVELCSSGCRPASVGQL